MEGAPKALTHHLPAKRTGNTPLRMLRDSSCDLVVFGRVSKEFSTSIIPNGKVTSKHVLARQPQHTFSKVIRKGKRIDNRHQQDESDVDSDVNSCQTVQRQISNDDVFSIAIPMETPPCASEPLCLRSESPRPKRQRLGINPEDAKTNNFVTVEGEGWERDEHSEFDMHE